MKALSIRQPWAWLIVHGAKDIENRKWWTNYRGPFLVHAGLQVDHFDPQDLREVCKDFGLDYPETLPTGGIVGSVDLVDCVTEDPSDWFEGPYGFILQNPRPLPFRPLKGKLGFFEVS